MDSVNKQLTEIASWRIVSELIRRHPEKFTVIETHPGGGQYDCLSPYSMQTKSRPSYQVELPNRLHGRYRQLVHLAKGVASKWEVKTGSGS